MNLPLRDFMAGLKSCKISVLDSVSFNFRPSDPFDFRGGTVEMLLDCEKHNFSVIAKIRWRYSKSSPPQVRLVHETANYELEPATLSVVNDEGEWVRSHKLDHHINVHVNLSEFTPQIYTGAFPAEPRLIKRDDDADISFVGSLLSRLVVRETEAKQWDELKIYKTIGGSFIAEQLTISTRPRAKIIRRAVVCKSEDEVYSFFGLGEPAQELQRRTSFWAKITMATTDQTFVLARDKNTDIKFNGHCLGTVSSKANRPRWTELSLYQTTAGPYICQIKGGSTVDSDLDRSEVLTADALDQVFRYFGHGRLAKQLYAAADIPCVEEVA